MYNYIQLVINCNDFDYYFYVERFNITYKTIKKNKKELKKCYSANRKKIVNVIKNEKAICFGHIWSDIAYPLINKFKDYHRLFKSLLLIQKTLHCKLLSQSIEINHILLTKVLKIKKNIISNVENTLRKYNKYIGFHIRTGAGDFKDIKRMKNNTIINMIKLGNLFDKNTTFFVASDYELVKQIFYEYYGDRVFIYSNKTYHSEYIKKDDISVIELLLLSKAKYMVLSKGSTYSLAAFFINDVCYKCNKYKFSLYNSIFYPDPKKLTYYIPICDF